MDDQGDDWGDTLAGFDIGDLSVEQRQTLSAALADAGILHAFIGAELQGPAAESELIEHLVARTRRGSGVRRPVDAAPVARPAAADVLPRALRLPWGAVPREALDLPIAARWRRFAAYLGEAIALGIVVGVLLRYSDAGGQLFGLAFQLVSGIVLVATLGATFGMMVLRMRVVTLGRPDRAAPGWSVALVRYLVAWWPELLLLVLDAFFDIDDLTWMGTLMQIWLIVCFTPVLLDPARRGLHDRVAGTVVIDVGR